MEDRIKLLAKWLNNVETSDFYYDSSTSGKLESTIVDSQVEVCNKIGDYLEEILQMDKKQLRDNLE
jgi:phosphopantothenate synthetase